MTTDERSILPLTPFALFVGLFLVSTVFFAGKISPLFSCLVAVVYSLFTFREKHNLTEKLDIFVRGSGRPTIIAMCYIFIFTAVFTYVLKQIGGIEAAVHVGLGLIPSPLLLPGFFAIVGLFATAIGSSMGTIAAFLPIGIGLAERIGLSSSLMAGIVVSGAMLGDNLSIISDTTIAATQTIGCTMREKWQENIRLVIPAFLITCLFLGVLNFVLPLTLVGPTVAVTAIDWVKTIPYAIILAFALAGVDVIAVLLSGIATGAIIGIWQGHFSFYEATGLILEGFTKDTGGIHEVLILSLFVAGLAAIVEHNGGIAYVLSHAERRIAGGRGAQWMIALMTFSINVAVAINTIAILITGPVAKHIGEQYNLSAGRVAALIDIVACICQGLLPYAPQLLLAGAIAHVPSVSIMPHLHYQFIILLVTMLSIYRSKR